MGQGLGSGATEPAVIELLSFLNVTIIQKAGCMFTADYFKPVLDRAIPVQLAARAFIVPVPTKIGYLLTYPYDIGDNALTQKGMPILDKNGQPKGTGLLFINDTDGAIQAVRDDGKGTIVINNLTSAQAALLLSWVKDQVSDPDKISAAQIFQVMDYARSIGVTDFYNASRSRIPDYEPVAATSSCAECGIFIRRSADQRQALLGIGSGTYAGPAGSPQRFVNNVVLVQDEKHAWLVQTKEFLKTYRHADDRAIDIAQLPAFAITLTRPPQPTVLQPK